MSFIMFLFFIGSFIGWIMEVCFKYFSGQSIEKAGMGKGPFCALYGIGTILLYIAIDRNVSEIPLIFLGSAFILTAIELATGLFMDQAFDLVLWDYSNKTLAINKHICGEFMIFWGLIGIIFVKFLLPFFHYIFSRIDTEFIYYVLTFGVTLIVIDYIVATFSNIYKMTKKKLAM